MRSSANRVAAARCGWWPHAFRGGFIDFIYVIIEVISTCMQNFKKIDLKKKTWFFFIQSCSALFLLHTVQCIRMLLFFKKKRPYIKKSKITPINTMSFK